MSDLWTCPDDGHLMSTWDDYKQHCKDTHDGLPVTVEYNWPQRSDGWNEPDSLAQQALDLAAENERLRAMLAESDRDLVPADGWVWCDAPGEGHHVYTHPVSAEHSPRCPGPHRTLLIGPTIGADDE